MQLLDSRGNKHRLPTAFNSIGNTDELWHSRRMKIARRMGRNIRRAIDWAVGKLKALIEFHTKSYLAIVAKKRIAELTLGPV